MLGKAGDFDIKSMTAEQARGLILDHQDMLPYHFRLEGKVGWLHFDSLIRGTVYTPWCFRYLTV